MKPLEERLKINRQKKLERLAVRAVQSLGFPTMSDVTIGSKLSEFKIRKDRKIEILDWFYDNLENELDEVDCQTWKSVKDIYKYLDKTLPK